MKIRIDAPGSRRGSRRSAVRAAVGDRLELMVDLNAGWRMPGDTTPALDVVAARAWPCARRAGRPVAGGAARRRGPPGHAALRAGAGIRIAGGEMTRTLAELLAALDADAFDVYQPDVVLAVACSVPGRSASSRSRGTAGSHRTPGPTGSGCWPTCTWQRAWAAGHISRCHTTRRAGRPSGATSCSRAGRRRLRRGGAGPTGAGPRYRAVPPGAGRARRRALGWRTVTDTATPTHADWIDRARAVRPHARPFIDGDYVTPLDGTPSLTRRRATGRYRGGRDRGRADVDRAVARRAARSRTGAGRIARPSPASGSSSASRNWSASTPTSSPCSRASTSDTRSRTHRRRRARGRELPPVVRRGGRQAVRGGRTDRSRRAVARDPRAARRRGRDRALELPADHHGLEARPGPRDRELGHPQAGEPVAVDRAAPRVARGGGRAPRRRPQRAARPGRRRGRGPRAASGRRQARVHGLDRDRPPAAPRERRLEPQARPARARRQEPAAHPRRRAGPRRRGRRGGVGIFYNAGQTCNAGSRVLVQRSIKDAFLVRLVAFAEALAPADPLDPATRFGSLVARTTSRPCSATWTSGGARARAS